MLVHSLASKYARFVVIVRQMYWTPPSDHWTPLLKSDDLFLGKQEISDPPFKNPAHALTFGADQNNKVLCRSRCGFVAPQCHANVK